MTAIVVLSLGLGVVLTVLGLPLWRALGPPNRWYGLRLPATLGSPSVWYAAAASVAGVLVAGYAAARDP